MNIRECPCKIHYTEYSLAKGQSSLNSINILFDLVIGRVSNDVSSISGCRPHRLHLLPAPAARRAICAKGVILAFVMVMLVFAIQPDWSSSVAKAVGISRGADLLFYVSHLTLFFIAFVYFVKFKEMEVRFTKLVRQLALESVDARRKPSIERPLGSSDQGARRGLERPGGRTACLNGLIAGVPRLVIRAAARCRTTTGGSARCR